MAWSVAEVVRALVLSGADMTASYVRSLPRLMLSGLYATLRATELPQGTFHGLAWSHDLPGIEYLNGLWTGKVFAGTKVMNLILGKQRIPGVVTLEGRDVVIRYPQLGLEDTLKPYRAQAGWIGRMRVGPSVVWFTLEREERHG